jgi:hypothetical protein
MKTSIVVLVGLTGCVLAFGACSSNDSGGGTGTGGFAAYGGSIQTGGTSSGGTSSGGTSSGGTSSGGTSSGGTSSGGTSSGGAAGSSTGGTGGQCSKISTLHPPNADAGTQTLYCPFSGVDGGSNDYCDTATEHCCEPKSGTASCTAKATPCASGDTDWQCEDPSECGSGMQCCGKGTMVKSTDANCGNYATGFTGTYCAASCAAGDIQMCTSDGECTSPQTCLPFNTKGNQVGGCYPQ